MLENSSLTLDTRFKKGKKMILKKFYIPKYKMDKKRDYILGLRDNLFKIFFEVLDSMRGFYGNIKDMREIHHKIEIFNFWDENLEDNIIEYNQDYKTKFDFSKLHIDGTDTGGIDSNSKNKILKNLDGYEKFLNYYKFKNAERLLRKIDYLKREINN